MPELPPLPETEPAADDEPSIREQARERARELREEHRRRDTRRRRIVWGSVLGGAGVLLGLVAIVIAFAVPAPARGPANMLSDGIKIGTDYVAVRTAGLQPKQDPVASGENPSGVLDIRIYVDYLCPNCATFEEENGEQLRTWLETGAATVEIHPIAVLTAKSAGSQYSLRAANAAACVAEYAPDSFFDFHTALFDAQPDEGTPGLDDTALRELAVSVGAPDSEAFRDCIDSKRFKSWVQAATNRALNGPLPGLELAAVTSTPTVVVDGRPFVSTQNFAAEEFQAFAQQVLGVAYTDEAAASATPTPTPTP